MQLALIFDATYIFFFHREKSWTFPFPPQEDYFEDPQI